MRDNLSRVPSISEWETLYTLSVKQALAGICFAGVQRLPKDIWPARLTLLKWFALSETIMKRNRLVTARLHDLYERFAAEGLRACFLKGQGMAKLYNLNLNKDSNLGLYRQSGDIDVWVDGERDETIRIMREHFRCGRVVFHHMDVEVFDDVPVEVHFVPSYAYSLPRYRAYKRFFSEYKEECFVSSGIGCYVPSIRFNVVYLLMHIFRHVFHEGIGLRQLMDYYFVLVANGIINGNVNWNGLLKDMGLLRFAGAVMYVECEVFGLKKEYMICEPDKKAGRFLLDEIMRAGNFGQYDPRIRDADSGGLVKLYLKNVKRLFGMVRLYPSEVLWAPFWKVWHWSWRKMKNY